MGAAADHAYLIWSLTSSGIGTTISGAGNSGGYTATTPNARTAVDLRFGWADDFWLSISATGGAGATLKAQLNLYDDQGNLFTNATAGIYFASLATAPGQTVAFGGRHGGSGGAYFVASEWGQIAWTITSGSMTGVEIALYGR